MGLEGGAKFFKYLLFFFNVFFLLCGFALLGIGIWTAIDRVYMSKLIGTGLMYETSGYIITAVGVIIIVISFLGCCGAVQEIKCLLISYFIFLLLIFILLLVAALLGVIFRADLEYLMQRTMNDTIKSSYGHPNYPDITLAWNEMQARLNCCAVHDNSWFVYRESYWFNRQIADPAEKMYVPESCCMRNYDGSYSNRRACQSPSGSNPPRTQTGATNYFLYYPGCYGKGYELLSDHGWILFGLAFGIALLLIGGMIISVCLVRSIEDY